MCPYERHFLVLFEFLVLEQGAVNLMPVCGAGSFGLYNTVLSVFVNDQHSLIKNEKEK